MNIQNIYISFLSFFSKKNYKVKIIKNVFNPLSKNLMFTNSGVAGVYEEFITDNMHKTATIQQCVRIDGKHNDLDDIGASDCHLTCFHMLGTFVTDNVNVYLMIKDVYDFICLYITHINCIYVTVHSEDSLSINAWKRIIKEDKIIIDNQNIWRMSDEDGYIGYCSEIRYVYNNKDIELWNIVIVDKEIKNGHENVLNKIKIDTGGGAERIYSVFTDTLSIYNNEQYDNYFAYMSQLCSITDARIILDHIRTISAMIYSGIFVSNNKRGYVLKKILRRLCYFMFKNNINVCDIMYICSIYIYNTYEVHIILHNEYISFIECIHMFTKYTKHTNELSVNDIIKLHTTYGIHYPLCYMLCDDKKIKYSKLSDDDIKNISVRQKVIKHSLAYKETEFIYDSLNISVNNICVMSHNDYNNIVDFIIENNKYYVTFRSTVFYPKSGGQDCDHGIITDNDNNIIFSVLSVMYVGKAIVCNVIAKVTRSVDNINKFIMIVNENRRTKLSCLHSAHHIVLNLITYIVKCKTYQCSSNILYNGAKLSLFSYHYNYMNIDNMNIMLDNIVKSRLQLYVARDVEFNIAKQNNIYLPDNYPNYVSTVYINCNYGVIHSKEICCGTHNVKSIKKIMFTKISGAKTHNQTYYFDILVY